MARTFIKIDTTQQAATYASELKAWVQAMSMGYERGRKLRAIMSNSNDGTVWTDLEALFGLPAGKGQATYDLVNGTVGAMEGTFQNSNGKSLSELLG